MVYTANIIYTLQIKNLSFKGNDITVLLNVKILLDSDSVGLGWDLKFSISNKLLGSTQYFWSTNHISSNIYFPRVVQCINKKNWHFSLLSLTDNSELFSQQTSILNSLVSFKKVVENGLKNIEE